MKILRSFWEKKITFGEGSIATFPRGGGRLTRRFNGGAISGSRPTVTRAIGQTARVVRVSLSLSLSLYGLYNRSFAKEPLVKLLSGNLEPACPPLRVRTTDRLASSELAKFSFRRTLVTVSIVTKKKAS